MKSIPVFRACYNVGKQEMNMKNNFSRIVVMLVAALGVTAAPVFAGGGDCPMGHSKDGTAMKECQPGCDKPCCKDKKDKLCPMHGKKDCCGHKQHSNAKMNFGPKIRK